MTLAVLKLLQLVTTPLTPHRPDAVLGVFTSRETLLLAACFELAVAYALLQSRNALCAGAVIVYFSLSMSLYQVGLLIAGDPRCACLGVATPWLGSDLATLVARVVLGVFWATGLWLIWRGRSTGAPAQGAAAAALPPQTSAGPITVLAVALSWPMFSVSLEAQTVLAEGHFFNIRHGSDTQPDPQSFSVLFDQKAILLTAQTPAPAGGRYGVSAAATVREYISRDVYLSHLPGHDHPAGFDGVVFENASIPWELGNCGSGLASCVFLMLRCAELFPGESGSRRLAPPWTMTGDARGLIFEAEYSWHRTNQRDPELLVDIRVSDFLKKNWTRSEFRSPLTSRPEERRRGQQIVDRHEAGFLNGTMRFQNSTNLFGIVFSTRLEVTVFRLPSRQAGQPGSDEPSNTYLVTLDRIESTSAPVEILPVQAPQIHVSERRLTDHDLAILSVEYRTNTIQTPEISPLAERLFEQERQKARAQIRMERNRKLMLSLLVTVVLLGPVPIILASRKRRGSNDR